MKTTKTLLIANLFLTLILVGCGSEPSIQEVDHSQTGSITPTPTPVPEAQLSDNWVYQLRVIWTDDLDLNVSVTHDSDVIDASHETEHCHYFRPDPLVPESKGVVIQCDEGGSFGATVLNPTGQAVQVRIESQVDRDSHGNLYGGNSYITTLDPQESWVGYQSL